jgi:hypothetical protein
MESVPELSAVFCSPSSLASPMYWAERSPSVAPTDSREKERDDRLGAGDHRDGAVRAPVPRGHPADARAAAAGGLHEHEDQLRVHDRPRRHLRAAANALSDHTATPYLRMI